MNFKELHLTFVEDTQGITSWLLTLSSLQVTATDGDKDRPENIVYFLTGQGIDTDRPDQSKFDINKTTGEIFVLKVGLMFITHKESSDDL